MEKQFKYIALILAVVYGCYSDDPGYIDKIDAVYTNFDAGFDFKAVSTFALPDEVIKVEKQNFNHPERNEPEFVSAPHGEIILNSIRENMLNLGWTEVEKNDGPDVIILPSVSTSTHIYYYYDWYYWHWWYPGWYSGWSWYYPGYYYPVYRSGYTSGTLFIQMTDNRNGQVNNNVAVPWSAVINGVMEAGRSQINQRLRSTIDQAFDQSPYLKKSTGS
ncbi:DUF4136 domain-containing protein [Lunatibacter salilacus]|uniref:DUF4136 domain-containing protein n=1 Tax=Lunatibacter salilacus TaxID=2483804 RepID=UPI00131A99BE|nr:DUF4136 domain-containing protein [Lunatibacter salilacus]